MIVIKENLFLKEKLLNYIKNTELTSYRNSMGKSENLHNPYYLITQTLSKEEIKNMSDEQVEKLMRLANYC